MKISKSKRQLAQLLIEAGVKQFPEGANWAAQDGGRDAFPRRVYLYRDKPIMPPGSSRWISDCGAVHLETGRIIPEVLIPNWHQTALSRAEFDQIVAESAEQSKPRYCESVTRAIPDPVTAPTLDQLLHDYRNASDFAAAKQAEADEAANMRDERWKSAQARACELGVRISVELIVDAEMHEPELVITDWRDLRIGDIVMVVGCSHNPDWSMLSGVELEVVETGDCLNSLCFKPKDGKRWRCGDNTRWVFIRRPQQQETK